MERELLILVDRQSFIVDEGRLLKCLCARFGGARPLVVLLVMRERHGGQDREGMFRISGALMQRLQLSEAPPRLQGKEAREDCTGQPSSWASRNYFIKNAQESNPGVHFLSRARRPVFSDASWGGSCGAMGCQDQARSLSTGQLALSLDPQTLAPAHKRILEN